MLKHKSSASRVPPLRRIAALRTFSHADAFGLALQSASHDRTGKIEGAITYRKAAGRLFTSRSDLLVKARWPT